MPMCVHRKTLENFTIIISNEGAIYTSVLLDIRYQLWYNNKDKTKERNGQ